MANEEQAPWECNECGVSVSANGGDYCTACQEERDDREAARVLMEDIAEALDQVEGVRRVETFKEATLLTRDEGFVLSLEDGRELQVTVVDSTRRRR